MARARGVTALLVGAIDVAGIAVGTVAVAATAAAAEPVALLPVGDGDIEWHHAAVAYLAAGPILARGNVQIVDAARSLGADDAAAGAAADEAEALHRDGLSAYARADFKAAREKLRAAVGKYREAFVGRDTREDLARALHALAAANLMDGDLDGATSALRMAVRLRPDLTPSTDEFPPALADLFRSVAAENVAEGTLSLRPSPEAMARVDGQSRGVTPLDLAVDGGEHFVEVRRPGYRVEAGWLKVDPGQTRALEVALGTARSGDQLLDALARAAAEFGDARSPAAEDVALIVGVREVILIRASGDRVEAVWRRGADAAKRARGSDGEEVARALLAAPAAKKPDEGVTEQEEVDDEVEPDGGPRPLWKRWWVWAAGAAIVGGAVAGVVVATRPEAPVVQVR